MQVISPVSKDIVKNYFLNEGDTGKVVKIEKKSIDSIPRSMLNYLTQIEVGPYNMNHKFPPGEYYFIWVQFNKYIRHLFISSANVEQKGPPPFFIFSTVQLKFDDPSGFVVW